MREPDQLVGRVAHRREDADDTPALLAGTRTRPARDLLDLLRVGDGAAIELHHHEVGAICRCVGCDLRHRFVVRGRHRVYISRRPDSARPSVTSSAYSRSPPTGSPLARARHAHRGRAAARRMGCRGLAGRIRVRGEDDLDHAVALHAVHELVDPQVLGLDAVGGDQRPAEDVVKAHTPPSARARRRRRAAPRRRSSSDRRRASRRRSRRPRPRSGCRRSRQKRTRSFTSSIAPASERPSSFSVWRRWNASRCAVRLPIPGEARQLRDEVLDGGAQHVA